MCLNPNVPNRREPEEPDCQKEEYETRGGGIKLKYLESIYLSVQYATLTWKKNLKC